MAVANSGMHLPPATEHSAEMFRTLQAYQEAVNEAAIVSITDLQGDIIYVNQRFVDISKYPKEELIGQNHRIINSGFHPTSFFRDMWTNIRSGRSWRGEIKNKAKDGSFYWVDTVITPIVDNDGIIYQFLSIRNLITAQKENEDRLLSVQQEMIKREKLLSDAQKVAKTGSWYLTVPDNNRIEWSEETYHIFEIDTGTEMTYQKFLESVHPDDRSIVIDTWQEALKIGQYHVEHRIITKSGEKWVSERARFEFDATADLISALGTVQDITEIKKIEESLRESENLYKTLFNTSPFAVGIVDKNTLQFLEVNETAVRLYGYQREEFLRFTLYDIRVAEEHDKLTQLLSNDQYPGDISIRTHKKKNGEILFVEPAITSMDYKGRSVYLITIHDITDRVTVESKLKLAEQSKQKEIIEAEEKSRSQIGMELHDNVNQMLVATRLYLERIPKFPDETLTLLTTAKEILSDAVDEIRKLSATLVTPILINNSLKNSIEDLSASYTLLNAAIETDININEDNISQELKTNIYRIIQEQFNNIVKHANATKITLELIEQRDYLVLQIKDNGRGFDLNQSKKGIGLTNIIYRAKAYGGKIAIDTGIDKGCHLKIQFDLKGPLMG